MSPNAASLTVHAVTAEPAALARLPRWVDQELANDLRDALAGIEQIVLLLRIAVTRESHVAKVTHARHTIAASEDLLRRFDASAAFTDQETLMSLLVEMNCLCSEVGALGLLHPE